ncbi:serine/threonine-protein kinase [Streptomyces sp. SCSIO ZS0520]|uniref:serine/threonine-protein kinase n=1 Tax=Streptomyces sp. SCSIO ZS0520 TaxID=2892996 RepID=UPI0021DB557C|nr:serine/threonine-protein kinase [Streptomyces sp. SCSIO ZS0520]
MGEVFAGRYELADPIGRGGVGAVWRAWDHRRRRYVAAKVLQQSDAHTLLRFVREQALRIDHPHVLAPASWAADDDKVLFTMDLVGGGSLAHLIGDYGPLPPRFVCTLLDQLLAGLAAVHAEGVVHRDIKPANVLLEATGSGRPHLRLSDFGIAMRKGEPRLTETDYVVGTPGYFAPEQMLGSEPDFPADLFAVGLVALYLLEGAKPDARALIEYFAEHGTPRAPKGIPEPLWQVAATLLQPDPEARFRTATGARKALAAAAELLPEPSLDEDELVEVFDQLGPLPEGFGPEGPLRGRPRHPRPPAPPAPPLTPPATPPSVPPRPPATPPATPPPATPPLAAGSPTPPSAAAPPSATTPPAAAASSPSLSDTGSFHLAPPPPAGAPRDMVPSPPPHPPTAPPEPPTGYRPYADPAPLPPPPPHPDPTPAPASPLYGNQNYGDQTPSTAQPSYAYPPTSRYTAQHTVHGAAASPTQTAARPTAPSRRKRKPGPPVKAVVLLLGAATLSFAVGTWGLLQLF